MRQALPLLTAGVGICFLGLDLVTTGLQESTSRTLRALIRRSTTEAADATRNVTDRLEAAQHAAEELTATGTMLEELVSRFQV